MEFICNAELTNISEAESFRVSSEREITPITLSVKVEAPHEDLYQDYSGYKELRIGSNRPEYSDVLVNQGLDKIIEKGVGYRFKVKLVSLSPLAIEVRQR